MRERDTRAVQRASSCRAAQEEFSKAAGDWFKTESEHCFSQLIVGAGSPKEGLAQIHGQQGTERMDRKGGSLLEELKSRLEGAWSSWSLEGCSCPWQRVGLGDL